MLGFRGQALKAATGGEGSQKECPVCQAATSHEKDAAGGVILRRRPPRMDIASQIFPLAHVCISLNMRVLNAGADDL